MYGVLGASWMYISQILLPYQWWDPFSYWTTSLLTPFVAASSVFPFLVISAMLTPGRIITGLSRLALWDLLEIGDEGLASPDNPGLGTLTRSSAIAVIADRTACSILTLFIVTATSRPLNKKSVCCQSANPINKYCGSASANPQSAHLSARAVLGTGLAPNGTVSSSRLTALETR